MYAKTILALVVLLFFTGCSQSVVYRDPPRLPELPDNIYTPCPGLDPLADRTKGSLVIAVSDGAYKYKECKDRHAAAVNSYNIARDAVEAYHQEAEKAKQTKKK